jgi:hypothetical protein
MLHIKIEIDTFKMIFNLIISEEIVPKTLTLCSWRILNKITDKKITSVHSEHRQNLHTN